MRKDIVRDTPSLEEFCDYIERKGYDIDLSMWKVKDMEWVKDCQVPEGEDFRRIKELF